MPSNAEENATRELRVAVIDHLLGAPAFDWIASAQARIERQQREALGGPSLPLTAYAGRYRDPCYGDLAVTVERGALRIDFTRTPVFKSRLEPFGPDTFRTRFPNGAGEDAVVTFVVEGGRVARLRLRALSPFADFSYDFHDLNPVRVE